MGKRRISLTEKVKGLSSDLSSQELQGEETVVQTENRKVQELDYY